MPACKVSVNNVYGSYVVREFKGKDKRGNYMWECECICGKHFILTSNNLVSKIPQCSHRIKRNNNIKYRKASSSSESGTRLYSMFRSMIRRCYYPSTNSYAFYGGRGIGVCDEWRNSFLTFKRWAYLNGYDETRKDQVINRIDNSCDYSPVNCSIITVSENNRHKTTSLIYKGKLVIDWAREYKISYSRVRRYFHKHGKSLSGLCGIK